MARVTPGSAELSDTAAEGRGLVRCQGPPHVREQRLPPNARCFHHQRTSQPAARELRSQEDPGFKRNRSGLRIAGLRALGSNTAEGLCRASRPQGQKLHRLAWSLPRSHRSLYCPRFTEEEMEAQRG